MSSPLYSLQSESAMVTGWGGGGGHVHSKEKGNITVATNMHSHDVDDDDGPLVWWVVLRLYSYSGTKII